MKRIYFVRHGQSQANVDSIGAGAEMDSPLTEIGKEQARLAGKKLKSRQIDLIVSSPLERAFKTAEIMADQIGYDKSKIVKNELLVERYIGSYSGRPIKEFGDAIEGNSLDETVEPSEKLFNRGEQILKWLKSLNSKNILIVSHSDISAALRLIHRGLSHAELYKLESFPNGSIYEFDIE